MKIKIVKYPYGEYEIGEIVDLGEEKNKSLVEEFQRAVWVEDKKKTKKKAKKTTTKTSSKSQEEEETEESEELEETEEGKKPARGPDGKFVSTKEPKKRGFFSKLK